MRSCWSTVPLLLVVAAVPVSLEAGTVTFDFEGFPDSTVLTNQYPGLTFTNASVITAGISLNEFEFPPHSGVNVAFDDGGPISISFASPVLSFSGYFTYLERLTLTAFDSTTVQVASATSAFSGNLALSGDPGSSPNEFLSVVFAGGISGVTITGNPLGGSFVLDDAAYTVAAAGVPEPSSFMLCLIGSGALFFVLLFRAGACVGVAGRVSRGSWPCVFVAFLLVPPGLFAQVPAVAPLPVPHHLARRAAAQSTSHPWSARSETELIAAADFFTVEVWTRSA